MDTIAELTLELMGAQDSVTHLNEAGPAHQDATLEMIARRDAIRNELHKYVRGLLGALDELVEIERRDNLTDPDMTATDAGRERAWQNARAVIAKARGESQKG